MIKNKKSLFSPIFYAIPAAGGTIGIGYLGNLAAGSVLTTQSFFCVLIFLALFLFWRHTIERITKEKQEDSTFKRRLLFSALFSWFLGVTLVLGYQIRTMLMTSGGFGGKLFILFMGALAGCALWPFMDLLWHTCEKRKIASADMNFSDDALAKKKNRLVFFISWGVIFACWIPVFLAYYPAVMAYDFNMQSVQIMTGTYHTHHPLIHTGLLGIFFQLGKAVGSYSLGMACFALFQMLILSCITGYSCTFVWRLWQKKLPVILTVLFYGLLPIHSVLSVSITKDVLFSGFFLLFLLLLCEKEFMGHRTGPWFDVCMVLTGSLMLLFRNNAIYAFVPFALFYILANRRKWLRTGLICLLILFLGKGSALALQYGLDAGTGSISEMCSVPMQQFARVGFLHGETLSEEDYARIDWYVYDEYWQRYNPPIADTVKITVAADGIEHWEENLAATARDWLIVGLHYPNEYLDAFLCLTSGYWFLDDVSFAEVLGASLEDRMGALYTFNASASSAFEGIESHSLFPWLEQKMEEIVSANAFFQWPVLSQLFKPALYCLLLVFGFLVFWYRREWKKELLVLLPLFYLFTLLLGPVALIRYAYPFILLAPMLLSMLLLPES